MKFDVTKTMQLAFLGEDWKECSITFKSLTIGQARAFQSLKDDQMLQESLDLLKQNFVKGEGISDGKKVSMKKEHIDDFPIELINKSIELLVGDVVTSEEVAKKKS